MHGGHQSGPNTNQSPAWRRQDRAEPAMWVFPLRALIGLLFASALTGVCAAEQRGADLLMVNSLADPGTGVCDAAECTLREAIAQAASIPGQVTIEFEPGLSGAITLGAELLISFNGLTINGPGPEVIEISGNNATRVFTLSNSDAIIRGLTIRDGNSGSGNGAGISISGDGSPVLEHLRIVNNVNTGQGAGVWVFFGGATLRNLEISDNTGFLAALLINGAEGDHVLVENVTISGNVGNQQATGLQILANSGQNVTLRYLTVTNNTGSQRGASISGSGQIIVEASIFAANGGQIDLSVANESGSVNNSLIENFQGAIPGENNLLNVAPTLGPLQFVQGSTTRAHTLGPGPGVDHVDNLVSQPGCGTLVTTDQIGNARPVGASCDAGAFELPHGFDTLFDDRFETTP